MLRRVLFALMALSWGAVIAVLMAADAYFIFVEVPEIVHHTLCSLLESPCDHFEFMGSELLLDTLAACVLLPASSAILLCLFRAIEFIPDEPSPDDEKDE